MIYVILPWGLYLRSPQQMKQMHISGRVDSLNKAFLPKQSFQSSFKAQSWDSLDPEVHCLFNSVEELNCLPKVGEKLWKQQQQAAPSEPEKHLQKICSYSVNWIASQGQFDGWFDSEALALHYAGDIHFSATTLETVYAWKISLNNRRSLSFFFCELFCFVWVLFGGCHCLFVLFICFVCFALPLLTLSCCGWGWDIYPTL